MRTIPTAVFGSLLFNASVWAHDPGFSEALIRPFRHGWSIRLSFNPSDAELLEPVERSVSTDVRLVGDRSVSPVFVGTSIVAEGVDVEIRFPPVRAETIVLDLTFLKRLPRGHRQLVSVMDSRGELLMESVLDARRTTLSIPRQSSPTRIDDEDEHHAGGAIAVLVACFVAGAALVEAIGRARLERA